MKKKQLISEASQVISGTEIDHEHVCMLRLKYSVQWNSHKHRDGENFLDSFDEFNRQKVSLR
jgi:hypothetical protein